MDSLASSPLLLVPLEEETIFFSLKDDNIQKFKNLPEFFLPVGFSNGWLILLDERSDHYLLNPFYQTQINLPKKETFPHINSVTEVSDESLIVEYKSGFSRLFKPAWEDFRSVLANPFSDKDFIVVVIYGEKSRIAHCKPGDKNWTEIPDGANQYYDISCFDALVYGLRKGPSVDVWELNVSSRVPEKVTSIQPSLPRKFSQVDEDFSKGLYTSQWYIVPCITGQAFFVTSEGELIREGDLLTDEDTQPRICPYKTVNFQVYRLNLTSKTWEEAKTLNDHALFVGGNNSVSVLASDHPECKANFIYFTDDYWDRVDEDYSYGGHDMGVFSLEDQSVKPFVETRLLKISPPPFWILP